jgi:hypothetical protein
MNKNRYKYFKWTPKTARITVLFTLIIPASFFYLGYATEVRNPSAHTESLVLTDLQGKYDFKNKRRGDTISEW